MKIAENKTAPATQSRQRQDVDQQHFFQNAATNDVSGNAREAFFSPNGHANNLKSYLGKPEIQTKLTIGQPGDKYEQEADAMAERVVLMKESDLPPINRAGSPEVQTSCAECEEEQQLQRLTKEEEPALQKKETVEDEKSEIQAPPSLMRKTADGSSVGTSSLTSQLGNSKGGGQPLPPETNSFMSRSFGADFGHVRVHTDSKATEMNEGLRARAFTHGADVYFNKGEYNPESSDGKRLLAHELTHVVQQGEGVKTKRSPETHSNTTPINNNSNGITTAPSPVPALESPKDDTVEEEQALQREVVQSAPTLAPPPDDENTPDVQKQTGLNDSSISLGENAFEDSEEPSFSEFISPFSTFEPLPEENLSSDIEAFIELGQMSDNDQVADENQEEVGPGSLSGTISESHPAPVPVGESRIEIASQNSSSLRGEAPPSIEGGRGGGPQLEDEPLMPEPPADLNPEAQQRMARSQTNMTRNSAETAVLPTEAENTLSAREGVTEPTEETAARASGELVGELGRRPEPSPEIEQLCAEIEAAIRERRPLDEDELLETDMEETANEAGSQLNENISSDTERVEGEYEEMDQEPAGEREQEGQTPETPLVEVEAPAVNATEAAPDPLGEEAVSLDNDVENTANAMEQAGMSTEVANEIQDPNNPVVAARETHGELEQEAEESPAEVLAQQDAAIANAQANMENLQAQALQALRQSRSGTISGTSSQQLQMIGSEEQKRAEVGRRAEEIFTNAQNQVNTLLESLPETAMEMWNTGKERLATEFRQRLDRVQAWIDERHSGFGGAIVGVVDAVVGLPSWVTREYEGAEQQFSDGVCDKIREISSYVNGIILTCEELIDQADQQINTVFEQAREELGDWALQQQEQFRSRLSGLREHVQETQQNFNRDLMRQATQAVREVQQEVQALREQARGLIGAIADMIQDFLDDPFRFIINGLLSLVGIEPPRFWALVDRIQQVIRDIAEDPVGFATNLLRAIGAGFQKFFDNIGTHLLEGLIEWLFSGLGAMGIQVPREFSLSSIITFFLQIMGITWDRIRTILARHIGEENVELIEQAFQMLSNLIEMGPEGIFQWLEDLLDPQNILDMILDIAIDFLIETLIRQATIRIIALFNPVGAIAQAIEAIYKVLKWIFENAARIFTLVETVVNGIADILAGNFNGMANAVEQALKRLLVPVIDFIAEFLGLGALPERVADAVKGLQEWVEGLMEQAIAWLATQARALLQRLGLVDEEEASAGEEELDDSEVGETVNFSAAGESHRLWIAEQGGVEVMVASETPKPVDDKLNEWEGRLDSLEEAQQSEARSLIAQARTQYNLTKTEAQDAKTEIDQAQQDATEEAIHEAEQADQEVESAEQTLKSSLERLFELFGEDIREKSIEEFKNQVRQLGGVQNVNHLKEIKNQVLVTNRPLGLNQFKLTIDNTLSSIKISASASPDLEVTILFNDVFSKVSNEDKESLGRKFSVQGQTTHATLTVNGQLFASVSSGGKHAEEKILNSQNWEDALDFAEQISGTRDVILSINRTPCHSICSPKLRQVFSDNSRAAFLKRNGVKFIIAATGTYLPERELTESEKIEEERLSKKMSSYIKMNPNLTKDEIENLKRYANTPNRVYEKEAATTYHDLIDLMSHGWELRQLISTERDVDISENRRDLNQALAKLKTSFVSESNQVLSD